MRVPPWSRARSPLRTHSLVTDAVLALSLTSFSMLLGREPPPDPWREFDPLAWTLTALINAPIVLRRRMPGTVLFVCLAAGFGFVAAGYWPLVNATGVLVALYTVATACPWWMTAAGATACAVNWIYGGLIAPGSSMPGVVAQSLIVPAAVWRVGRGTGQLAERNRQLAEAAEELRRGQQERERRAIVDERLRIARELHDVVAHHMSVISIQAGVARYLLRSDPDTADGALHTVLGTTGEALDEMRRLLALLRLDTASSTRRRGLYAPAPGLTDLTDLVNRVRTAGLPVEVEVSGIPRPLSSGVELCAYRTIQECLTNVLKHAGPATATAVRVYYGPDRLVVTVSDDGNGTTTRPSGSAGHGLVGMRERASLYGGTLVAGPRPRGGFEVILVLPAGSVTSPMPDSQCGQPDGSPGEGR